MFYVLILLLELSLFSDSHAGEVVPAGTCTAGTDFEKSGYSIRTARVESPFSYLRWLRDAITDGDRSVLQLTGQPYQNAAVRMKADELEKLNFLPEAIEQRVRISLVITSVENCSNGQLDLVYSVLTTQIAPVLSATFESQKAEKVSPESSAGTDAIKNRWRFSPAVSYDRAERFSGGAQLGYRAGSAPAKFLPFDPPVVDGRPSFYIHHANPAS